MPRKTSMRWTLMKLTHGKSILHHWSFIDYAGKKLTKETFKLYLSVCFNSVIRVQVKVLQQLWLTQFPSCLLTTGIFRWEKSQTCQTKCKCFLGFFSHHNSSKSLLVKIKMTNEIHLPLVLQSRCDSDLTFVFLQHLVSSMQPQWVFIRLFSCSSQSIWKLWFCSTNSHPSIWTAAVVGHQDC